MVHSNGKKVWGDGESQCVARVPSVVATGAPEGGDGEMGRWGDGE
ncbi:MAG: hypothetical protein WBA93_05640 [Microcoleaceae cyanobacterium]